MSLVAVLVSWFAAQGSIPGGHLVVDGEMIVVKAGTEFDHIATNTMGEFLMTTPALSEGVMYVRTVNHLFAIGRRPALD